MEEDRTTISVGSDSTIERWWRERMDVERQKGVKVLKKRRSPDFTPT
jgi:hypothetical protein